MRATVRCWSLPHSTECLAGHFAPNTQFDPAKPCAAYNSQFSLNQVCSKAWRAAAHVKHLNRIQLVDTSPIQFPAHKLDGDWARGCDRTIPGPGVLERHQHAKLPWIFGLAKMDQQWISCIIERAEMQTGETLAAYQRQKLQGQTAVFDAARRGSVGMGGTVTFPRSVFYQQLWKTVS